MLSRRTLLKSALLAPLVRQWPAEARPLPLPLQKPPRLKPGDTVGLFCPAAPAYSREQVQITIESLQALGLKARLAPHFYDRYGYLAGRDADRAADLNAFFADPSIHALMAMHGGWGCARLLPLLNYEQMRRTPKILIGYSDITALLLAINAKAGLATMHGPEGAATWNRFTVDWLRRVLMDGEATLFQNPTDKGDTLTQTRDRITTLNPGIARGRLLGGNLTVLSHLIGTPYVPDWKGAILFLEDVHEEPYSVDRMLTQLKLAGVLDQVAGVVFGKCTKCETEGSYGSLTLEDVLATYLEPLKVPAFSGAMIGHIVDKFTIPLGINAEIDATKGTIRLLEAAVA
ncbi:peptidase U61 LD-carboxypeptidase A [Fibrella aestuarina BUZ 2]|uniref:Peptidase U61 LD-carboxypeptidase A n=1 Tax=Fibrella aestuarina BUZ 2 TaxID=1166018 RepID=I0KEP6_9BACT|nr:LD-carboxypeptidase [Fibrella aestuarina]CCH02599.1 peptidase U61 LD-carboxypeptidase A [Fibrella aestuarina BUZ 2]